MHINDILTYTKGPTSKKTIRPFGAVAEECSAYLRESAGRPLYRSFVTHSSPLIDNLYKVKVRHKKTIEPTLTELYSDAFVPKLRERAVFTYGAPRKLELNEQQYYVFPKNGYRYLYSKEVTDSNDDYKQVLDALIETVEYDRAYEIIADMLKFTYSNTNLLEGIQENAEILFYNIPYFYAIPTRPFSTYTDVLQLIHGE